MTTFIKKTILLSVISLSAISLKSIGQDIVITDKHDTIRCKLSRGWMGVIKYKTEKGDPIKIELGNVREFYSENKKMWVRRVYITSSRIPCFVDVLVTGKLNLSEPRGKPTYYDGSLTYARVDPMSTSPVPPTKTQHFVAKTTETAEGVMDDDISRGKNKELLDAKFVPFVQDNKDVYNRYQAEGHISFGELKKLVEMYNGSK